MKHTTKYLILLAALVLTTSTPLTAMKKLRKRLGFNKSGNTQPAVNTRGPKMSTWRKIKTRVRNPFSYQTAKTKYLQEKGKSLSELKNDYNKLASNPAGRNLSGSKAESKNRTNTFYDTTTDTFTRQSTGPSYPAETKVAKSTPGAPALPERKYTASFISPATAPTLPKRPTVYAAPVATATVKPMKVVVPASGIKVSQQVPTPPVGGPPPPPASGAPAPMPTPAAQKTQQTTQPGMGSVLADIKKPQQLNPVTPQQKKVESPMSFLQAAIAKQRGAATGKGSAAKPQKTPQVTVGSVVQTPTTTQVKPQAQPIQSAPKPGSALLGQIQQGTKLKKVTTVEKGSLAYQQQKKKEQQEAQVGIFSGSEAWKKFQER